MTQFEKNITRDSALDIIKSFAKEYRKELGNVPGEIIIVGGASIVLNYSFRQATQDFDVILRTVSSVNYVIKKFADENGLPRDWMNTDFMKTESYSSVLTEASTHFCTLNNGTLEIRTVAGVYLVAMKIRAHRDFRNDFSDALGVWLEEAENGNRISIENLQSAYTKLYKDEIPQDIFERIEMIFSKNLDEIKEIYKKQRDSEKEIGVKLVSYIEKGAEINTRNVDDVVARIKERLKNDSPSSP